MSEWGYFAVDRGIWGHEFLAGEPYTRMQAWLWLISAATWKPITVGYCGKTIPIERGEFCFSLRFLADKWGWTIKRVRVFLDGAEKRHMLGHTIRAGAKVYSISNYNDYQAQSGDEGHGKGHGKGHDKGTGRAQEGHKEEEYKPLNHKKEVPLPKGNGRPEASVLPFPEPAQPKPATPPTPPPKPDPWKAVYDRGKEVLKHDAGWQIGVLRKMFDNKPHKVMAKIEDAGEKREPVMWMNKFLYDYGPPGTEVGAIAPLP